MSVPLAIVFTPLDSDALEHPPQVKGRQEQVGDMRPGTTLTDLREQWIREICTGLVDLAGKESALGPTRVSDELGDPVLLRALVIMRIAVLESHGHPTAVTVDKLVGAPLFTEPRPGKEELSKLVAAVRSHMERNGVRGGVLLFGLGLRVDSPESTYRLLMDYWFHQRTQVVATVKAQRELKTYWAIEDIPTTNEITLRSSTALHTYLDIWSHLEAQPEDVTQNFVILGLSKMGSNARERWLKEFPAHKARHLSELGSDRAQCTAALRYLHRAVDHPKTTAALRASATSAATLMEEQLTQIAATIDCLSETERDLIRDRTQQQSFRDNCVLTFLDWSFERRSGPSYSEAQAVHGMWGPTPWWVITSQSAEEEAAVRASVAEGVLPLGFELDPTQPNLLVLICRKPRTESVGLLARFIFDLENPAHACELLMIGRRKSVAVDAYAGPDDEWDFSANHLGTLRAIISRELAGRITDLATTALSELLQDSLDQEHDVHEGIPALKAILRHLRIEPIGRSLRGRHVITTIHPGIKGDLTSLSADPPVSIGDFIRLATARKLKGKQTTTESRSQTFRREIGFVYVLKNPASPGMLKIGFTRQLAEDRAKALSGTSVAFPFEVLFRAATARAEEVEQAVHLLLAAQRVTANREFFYVSLDTAIEAIRRCQRQVTGIDTWEPLPVIHRLRAGDRVALPLQSGNVFTRTAWPNLLSGSAEVLDLWQAHSDNDLLEIYATHDPGHVAGLSDNDPGGEEDPVPFLNREGSAPNGMLMGRERLVAGDRLVWLSDREGPESCRSVVFEADAFCQVTYRTWSPQTHPWGIPLLLNSLERDITLAMSEHVKKVLTLPAPRTWAPRSPNPDGGWAMPATQHPSPDYWLSQLKPPSRDRRKAKDTPDSTGGPPFPATPDI